MYRTEIKFGYTDTIKVKEFEDMTEAYRHFNDHVRRAGVKACSLYKGDKRIAYKDR